MRVRWFRRILGVLTGIALLVTIVLFLAVVRLNDADYIAQAIPPKPEDTIPPTITLKGDSEITILIGQNYEEPGVDAYDDRYETVVETVGEIDTSTEGSYTLKYVATDEKNNSSEVTRTVKVIPPRGRIYLTFDDGPGYHTDELLDILAKYNVKATFFVTGNGDDNLILREYNEGHAVGLHTLTHNYAYIYQSADNFFDDLYSVQQRVKDITGYTSYLMRFPGGSSNTVSARYDGGSNIMSTLAREVESRGFTYFDWNLSSGDAGGITTSDGVADRVISSLEDGDYVILQHDIKSFSVAAVERIIQYGLQNGFVFSKLDASSPTMHHGINN